MSMAKSADGWQKQPELFLLSEKIEKIIDAHGRLCFNNCKSNNTTL
jgi:hypothetical protein